ncbi:MAG: UDP-N-acetylglucosamine 2-epimerase (non-hydrolyzing) [Planctomycetota bacterium]
MDTGESPSRALRVATVFGTRPEVIKVAPVIRVMEAQPARFRTLNVGTGQHAQLMGAFAGELGVRIDADLAVGRANQTPLGVVERTLAGLDRWVAEHRPDVLLVQGDTTAAFAGALAGYYGRVPVGHIEAGLRSGRRDDPFPEEMHRRLIGRLASVHFAATARNVDALLSEGVEKHRVVHTGNTVVDAVRWAIENGSATPSVDALLSRVGDGRLVVLTTHRRESFGDTMAQNLDAIRAFVEEYEDLRLVFPVHPNPAVREAAERHLGTCRRVHLVEPMGYFEFVRLLRAAWLVVSDSGGVQEEAPSLGKALLVIRKTTERPEGVEAGVAKLCDSPSKLGVALGEAYLTDWPRRVEAIPNPYGEGDAAQRITDHLWETFGTERARRARTQGSEEDTWPNAAEINPAMAKTGHTS